MPRHRSYRTNSNLQPVSSEWTSSQLVIGIAVAIVFGVVCFMFGYVIARYDRPIEPRDLLATNTPPVAAVGSGASTETPAVVTPPKYERKRPKNAEAPTITTKPADVATPAPTSAPTPEPKPADPTIQRPGLRSAEIEPLPSPGQPTPLVKTSIPLNKKPEITAPAPATPAESPSPSTTPATLSEPEFPAAPTDSETTVAANTKSPAPVTPPPVTPPAPEAPVSKPPTVTPPAPEAPVSKPPTVTRGSFGIQVAAFNGPKRDEQAQESKKLLKFSTGKEAEIIHSADGAYSKVVITGFPSREAAKSECEKIKAKPGYDAAWVVRLP